MRACQRRVTIPDGVLRGQRFNCQRPAMPAIDLCAAHAPSWMKERSHRLRWRASADGQRIERTREDGTVETRPTRYGSMTRLRAAIADANREDN